MRKDMACSVPSFAIIKSVRNDTRSLIRFCGNTLKMITRRPIMRSVKLPQSVLIKTFASNSGSPRSVAVNVNIWLANG